MHRLVALALLVLPGLLPTVKATHIMGGELTYRWLGGSDYLVSLVLYRDCAGVPVVSQENVYISSSTCGYSQLLPVNLVDTAVIASPCAGLLSTCDGGQAPGLEVYVYRDTIALPQACPDYEFTWTTCCRNAAVTNLVDPSTQSGFLQAWLNTVDGPGNSAPVYQELQMPFICSNVMFCQDNSTFDVDGDSLVFSMVPVQNGTLGPAAYAAPFSPTDPFPTVNGHAFDVSGGNHCAIPTTVGAWVVAYRIDEYRNGAWIGSTMREVQLWVVNCPSAMLGFTGTVMDSTGTPVNSGTVELWEYGLNSLSSTLIATTPVNAQGEYAFSGHPNGQYILRAVPDTMNTPGHATSYHLNTHYWDFAEVLGAVCDTTLPADITLVGVGNLAGTGYVSGYLGDLGIVRSQQGTPWEGVSVFLEAWPSHEPVAFDRTDADGLFAFANVPFGEYRVVFDHPGLPMLGHYRFTVNAQNPSHTGLDHGAEPNGFFPTGISTGLAEPSPLNLVISPNPVGQGRVTIGGLPDGPATLLVEDATGRTVDVQRTMVSNGRTTMATDGLPAGIYLIRIAGSGAIRLLKQ
ncbi:MAG TPA: carboxypeptidase regulatory-like domain-containing protein [Flavobacteriales bacterium]|nr:carboxypeptidase regulatory-like domain-containing protein [Flavobacteriales bacterium]HMR25896.1 carboxypeptidase regulatory-like domain-containing protein [Flavobacteriales bacterium]